MFSSPCSDQLMTIAEDEVLFSQVLNQMTKHQECGDVCNIPFNSRGVILWDKEIGTLCSPQILVDSGVERGDTNIFGKVKILLYQGDLS